MASRANLLQQFTKKFRVMLDSGFPMVEALEVAGQAEDHRWTQMMNQVAQDIARGLTLSRALARWPDRFPSYYVGSVASAEMSGQLVRTLEFLEGWLDREAALRGKLIKAMTYPLVVLLFSLVVVLVLFNTVIPKLMSSFSSDLSSQALPTQILMGMTAILSSPLFYVAALVVLAVAVWESRQPEFRERTLALLFATPAVGALLSTVSALRYVNTLVLLLEAGSSILPSLRAAAQSSGSPLLLSDAARMNRGVTEGEVLSDLWHARPDLYPAIIAQMAMVGESSSSLSEALKATLPYLEIESHQRLERFSEVVEPLLISGVALFIGFVAISVILPISRMTANL